MVILTVDGGFNQGTQEHVPGTPRLGYLTQKCVQDQVQSCFDKIQETFCDASGRASTLEADRLRLQSQFCSLIPGQLPLAFLCCVRAETILPGALTKRIK